MPRHRYDDDKQAAKPPKKPSKNMPKQKKLEAKSRGPRRRYDD